MMDLFIVRHGHSPMQNNDHARPLSEIGKQHARQAGQFIAQNTLHKPIIISSDAIRTKQTAEQIAIVLAVNEIQAEAIYYAASVGHWCDAINHNKQRKALILVGHNPTISELSHYLSQDYGFAFKPACVTHLQLKINTDGLRLPAQLLATFKPDTK